jgi:hypothetical protein
LLGLLFISCTPAATPDHLNFTPGSPVVVTQNTYAIEGFSLQYPDGWRIVTGPAEASQTVTFVSPDNCSIIVVAAGNTEPFTSSDCANMEFQTTRREITLNEQIVTIAGSAPTAQWRAFLPQFERVVASVVEN